MIHWGTSGYQAIIDETNNLSWKMGICSFSAFQHGHGFIAYPKGRNVERALGFSLTGTVSTSPNLAKVRARRAINDCRATRSLFS